MKKILGRGQSLEIRKEKVNIKNEKGMKLDKINKKEVTNTQGKQENEISKAGTKPKSKQTRAGREKKGMRLPITRSYFAYFISVQFYQRTCTCVPSSRFSRYTNIRLYMQISVREPLTCQQKAI